jgi:hypothetical protein
MKRWSELVVVAAILCGLANAEPQTHSSSQKVAPSISIGIAVSQSVVASGTRVELHILVTNVSKGLIHMGRDNGKDSAALYYTVDLRDTEGDSAPKTRFNRILHGEVHADPDKGGIITGSPIIFPLQPGETLKDDMILNDLFDLKVPGKYTVQIQHEDPVTHNPVKSNIITLTVTP